MNALYSKIIDNLPFFVVVITFAVIGVVYLTIKAHSYYLKINKTITTVDIHELNFNRFINHLEGMNDIKDSIRKIEEYIIKQNPIAIDCLIRKCSPYQVTPFGEALYKVSGGKDCIDAYGDIFVKEIEKRNPLVALDVENYALSVLNDNLKREYFNNIKNFVFASPSNVSLETPTGEKMEIPLQMENILFVMSIYLRDRYFNVHPEINVSEFFKN